MFGQYLTRNERNTDKNNRIDEYGEFKRMHQHVHNIIILVLSIYKTSYK